jgi:hypothetical protein
MNIRVVVEFNKINCFVDLKPDNFILIFIFINLLVDVTSFVQIESLK